MKETLSVTQPTQGSVYAYLRVSTQEQNEDRQRIAMQAYGIPEENFFLDKQSGKDFDRTEYQQMKKKLKKGDLLVVLSIDRLGRNYTEIQEEWRVITKVIQADIVVLDMELLDTRRGKDLLGIFVADIVLQVLSFVAETERKNIRARQAEGIAAAKARGQSFGRPRKKKPQNYETVKNKYVNQVISLTIAAKMAGVARDTFKAWVAADEGWMAGAENSSAESTVAESVVAAEIAVAKNADAGESIAESNASTENAVVEKTVPAESVSVENASAAECNAVEKSIAKSGNAEISTGESIVSENAVPEAVPPDAPEQTCALNESKKTDGKPPKSKAPSLHKNTQKKRKRRRKAKRKNSNYQV